MSLRYFFSDIQMPEQDGLSLAKKIWEKGNQWQGLDIPVCSLGILLLSACGALFQKCKFAEAFALSSLVISIHSIAGGMMQSFTYWILSLINVKFAPMCADFVRYSSVILLLIFTFHIVRKFFSGSVKNVCISILLVLIVQVLFITLAEAVV